MDKVLVLDGNQRSALAATRSLGLHNLQVVVADETLETLAGSSRYCKERFAYASPYTCTDKFIENIRSECAIKNINVLFPMTDITTDAILEKREFFNGIEIPFPTFEQYSNLTDKWKLIETAIGLGVPVPKTFFVKTLNDLPVFAGKLEYPVVLKPYRSRIHKNGEWISTSVHYARSYEELQSRVHENAYLRDHPFLIQEYIVGKGQGIFSLYNNGEALVFFAHRRLRERPPTGGVSVLSESISPDPQMLLYAKRILDNANWHGVAMVEFKVTPEGQPFLMEVNARFWGSLQLAIDAGVDFPYMLYQISQGEKIKKIEAYKIGIKSRWLLGDLDNLYLSVVKNIGGGSKIKSIVDFLKPHINTIPEVNRFKDFRPFCFELRKYFQG